MNKHSKKQQASMMHRVLQAAHDAKQHGVDVFFGYEPHCNSFEFRLFRNGWKVGTDPDVSMTHYEGATYGDSLQTMLDCITAAVENRKAGAGE